MISRTFVQQALFDQICSLGVEVNHGEVGRRGDKVGNELESEGRKQVRLKGELTFS